MNAERKMSSTLTSSLLLLVAILSSLAIIRGLPDCSKKQIRTISRKFSNCSYPFIRSGLNVDNDKEERCDSIKKVFNVCLDQATNGTCLTNHSVSLIRTRMMKMIGSKVLNNDDYPDEVCDYITELVKLAEDADDED